MLSRSWNHPWNAAHESQAISLKVPKMLKEERTSQTDLWSIYKRINQSQMRFTTEGQSQSSDLESSEDALWWAAKKLQNKSWTEKALRLVCLDFWSMSLNDLLLQSPLDTLFPQWVPPINNFLILTFCSSNNLIPILLLANINPTYLCL